MISTIIPCFNQSRFLRESVASLQRQTVADWEAIVVDDGSTDDTAAIAAALASEDSRVRVVRKVNGGLSSARNAGLDVIRGDWVQFLDADDVILPFKFEQHMQACSDAWSGTLTYVDYRHGREDDVYAAVHSDRPPIELNHPGNPMLDFASRWEFAFSIPIHCPLFPAALFRESGLRFNTSLPNHEDWYMWMDILRRTRAMIYIPVIGAMYRVHPASMCRNHALMAKGFRLAVNQQLKRGNHDPEMRRQLQRLCDRISWRIGERPIDEFRRRWIGRFRWRLPAWLHPAVWRAFGFRSDPS